MKFSSSSKNASAIINPMTKTAPEVRRLPASVVLVLALLATCMFALLAPGAAFAQSDSRAETPLTDDRPVLGILGLSAPDGRGVSVARVTSGSGASQAGIKSGDIITEVEGTKITSMEDLTTTLQKFKINDTITVTFERGGETQSVEVKLGSGRSTGRADPFEIPDFDPRLPERAPSAPDAPGFESPLSSGPDYRPVMVLFGTLITGSLIALIVLTLRKNRPATQPPVDQVETRSYVPASTPRGDALEVLKMRYAKGEVTRDEYLTMTADLNGSGAGASESPTKEL